MTQEKLPHRKELCLQSDSPYLWYKESVNDKSQKLLKDYTK